MKSLIVGMGFGQLYKDVLTQMGHEVVTVDRDQTKKADFIELTTALATHSQFDTAHICVPNHLHFKVAQKVAPHTKLVFVEKPGVESSDHWRILNNLNQPTRFVMTKNNMWRDNIEEMKKKFASSDLVQINWINGNRIPNPGTWFTNKKFALGGVEKDLLPHLISLFVAVAGPNFKDYSVKKFTTEQKYTLKDCTGTDYGVVDKNGVYDVPDHAELTLSNGDKTFILNASWKSPFGDDIAMHFYKGGENNGESIQLGLCPESAYRKMIEDTLVHMEDGYFWNNQLDIDLWIQELLNENSENTLH